METILRHWTLLRSVPRAPRKAEARALLERLQDQGFAVTKRTVERDLEKLSGIFPIQHDDRSIPYGWCWMHDAQPLDIPGMDPETALTFAVLDRFARHLLPGNVTQRFQPHVERAQTVLASLDAETGPALWPRRVRFLSRSLPLHPPTVEAGVADVIYRALLEGRCFSGLYRSRAGGGTESREYVVNPLGLVFRDQIAYLVGTLWQYDDIRQLVLHRFETAELLDEPAAPRPDFDLDVYIAEGHFLIRETDQTLALRARFASGAEYHLAETPLAQDQVMRTCEDGRTELSATVNDTAQLRWWLLGFGGSVEVIAPERLRTEIAQVLAGAAALYSG